MEDDIKSSECFPSSNWDLMDNRELLLMKLSSEQASVNQPVLHDEYSDESDFDEMELDEDEELHKLSQRDQLADAVGAALERVQNFSRNADFLPQASQPVSEKGSFQSTLFHASSLPESIDGGYDEVENLMNLPGGYDKAIKMSQALQRRFSAILANLHKALKENKDRQVEVKRTLRAIKEKDAEQKVCYQSREKYHLKTSCFAMPYFKDRSGSSAPMNADTLSKIDQGYLDLYTTRLNSWCNEDSKILLTNVAEGFKKKVISQLNRTKEDLERSIRNYDEKESESAESRLEDCLNQIKFFKNLSADKMEVPPDASIDWDEVSALGFDGYRTAEECYLHWKNYLHAEINKGVWTQEEDIKIQELVCQAGDSKPKWEEIARKLGTNRKGYQVLQRYASFIRPTLQPASWNAEDSKLLVDTVARLRIGSYIPWFQVNQSLRHFTPSQLRSRWKSLDPEVIRGPFTKEEDFVLVKGLYMFGLNWDLICHFIQGRLKGQVRDRFRRGILPGLTYKPWKGSEDRKIIENCSLGQQFWRKLKTTLPNREIPEIRLRFSTLQFWQNISKQLSKPPPLFPLSSTTEPDEINRIREQLPDIKNQKTISKMLQKPNMDLKHGLEELEKRQASIKKSRQAKELDKLLTDNTKIAKRPSLKRKPCRRPTRGPKSLSWYQKAFTEFFLPGRKDCNRSSYATGQHAIDVGVSLGNIMELNIKQPPTDEELESLPLCHFNDDDVEAVTELASKFQPPKHCGHSIPLIPPNSLTVGAMKSMLLNKTKLKQMANKQFLFYYVDDAQLHKLGTDEKDALDRIVMAKNESIIGESIVQSPPKKRKRKAASIAENVTKAIVLDGFDALAYSKNQLEEFVRPSPEVLKELQDNPHPSSSRHIDCKEESVEEVKEREDKLLFNRMLSVFFWPALLTEKRPAQWMSSMASNLYADLVKEAQTCPNEETDDNVPMPEIKEPKWGGKYGDLDIEEQQEIIETMEKKLAKRLGKTKNVSNFIIPDESSAGSSPRWKQRIIKMKRSVIVKKAWEERRKGLMPMPARVAKKKSPKSGVRRSLRKRN